MCSLAPVSPSYHLCFCLANWLCPFFLVPKPSTRSVSRSRANGFWNKNSPRKLEENRKNWCGLQQLQLGLCMTASKGSSNFPAYSAFFWSGGKTWQLMVSWKKARVDGTYFLLILEQYSYLAFFYFTGEYIHLSIFYCTAVNNTMLYNSLTVSEMQDAAHFSSRVLSRKG